MQLFQQHFPTPQNIKMKEKNCARISSLAISILKVVVAIFFVHHWLLLFAIFVLYVLSV